ncbi:GDSL esterase/lipase 6 [Striga asiatica]|uniref:GDSL esterase/lipase 6 n=1 Tax=Striga asiatica TaxID=4170 RepID=A0A5A7PJI6_STRAF|nr:GDSL esterase/lipase 6 [Striga asiatica]
MAAEFLEIPLQKPLLEIELEIVNGTRKNFPTNGINFGSAGSGVLTATNSEYLVSAVSTIRDVTGTARCCRRMTCRNLQRSVSTDRLPIIGRAFHGLRGRQRRLQRSPPPLNGITDGDFTRSAIPLTDRPPWRGHETPGQPRVRQKWRTGGSFIHGSDRDDEDTRVGNFRRTAEGHRTAVHGGDSLSRELRWDAEGFATASERDWRQNATGFRDRWRAAAGDDGRDARRGSENEAGFRGATFLGFDIGRIQIQRACEGGEFDINFGPEKKQSESLFWACEVAAEIGPMHRDFGREFGQWVGSFRTDIPEFDEEHVDGPFLLTLGCLVEVIDLSVANVVGVTPIQVQLQQFKTLVKQNKIDKKLVRDSLFFIQSGNNDIYGYFNPFHPPTLTPEAYVQSMVAQVENFVDTIYKLGARRISLFGLGPVGCIPARALLPGAPLTKCYGKINRMVKDFNMGLENMVTSFSVNYSGAVGVFGATYEIFQILQTNPKHYGFNDVENACCGYGKLGGELQCGMEGYTLCKSPNGHLFWDYFHPTERAYKLISKALWAGGPNHIRPFNLKKLCNITLPNNI